MRKKIARLKWLLTEKMKLEKFEKYPLTFGITPIEHLPRLTAAIDADIQIFAKREDCN